MPDALQHPKACVRKKAGENVPERSLMFDLIAVAYDDGDGKPYGVEPCRYPPSTARACSTLIRTR